MKSCVSLSSNLPRVINRSNLSPSRFASRLGDKFDRSMTLGKLLDNNAQLFILFLNSVRYPSELLEVSILYILVDLRAHESKSYDQIKLIRSV